MIQVIANDDGSYDFVSTGRWHEVRGLIEAAELKWRCAFIAAEDERERAAKREEAK
jgi:hypothetical protein